MQVSRITKSAAMRNRVVQEIASKLTRCMQIITPDRVPILRETIQRTVYLVIYFIIFVYKII